MRQPTSRDISAPASSSSKSVKKDGKSKVQSVPGQRYQCPNCPKNFSRIENLTRHMANHEEVSKFVCLVCRKRFTRSDLLNRHRRIHNNAQNDTPPKAANSRSAPEAEIKRESLDPQSFQEGTTSSPADGRIQIMSQNGIDNIQQGHPSMIPGNSPAHGLNSLMEAALAPQERYAFTPAQNLDPSLWNGFMLVGDNSNSYMGSYDADISWTLSSFHSESPPGNYLDADMMQTVSYRQDDVGQLDATDAEDEDTNDWPDKVARPDSSQPQAPSIVPLHLLPVSWQTILGEARASGLSLTTIRPFQLIFDCQYPALFNNQPYVSKAETTNCVFPCPVEYWEASSAASWKLLVGGQADGPLATYYLPALNACLLRKWVKPPPPATPTNSSIGSLVLVYAIHTHIFEWRQATSMLNPTGLVGAFGPHALPMGEALKTRRQWLVDALDSWGECYGPESPLGGGTAATLLQRLGYVALDVSLSDMHLVAGRSQNANDGDFAEENLKHWANSEMATSTMTHVYNMLELCHHLVSSGTAADASYETAVCLFTGGIVCWAFAKLKIKTRQPEGYKERDEVRRAAAALRELGCWRMCSMFGRILNKFDVPKA
ncbi:hypothetical protein BJ875DRAFT_390013 [Amylocarpus encephaloides]|uniref:C2H2-type domain-containing protein n=1 Tax=Amylocarpus encephaloides TaxID=45428 RepID=A0A9P7Y7G0_9HELO|nr:hypothetical protein BJ875DRAFT_390013 [Amylocarpus encephaloides]